MATTTKTSGPSLRTWLLLIAVASKEVLARLPIVRQTTSMVPTFYYNGTFASDECLNKFLCSSDTDNARECSCHPQCALFDSCCEDMRPPNWREKVLEPDAFECTPVLLSSSSNASVARLTARVYFYVVTKCPRNFGIPTLRAFCEEPSSFVANGTVLALVTDNSTTLTYANKFCAICNGVPLSRVVSWPVQDVCANMPALGFNGCQQRWIKPTNIMKPPDCLDPKSYIGSCPSNSLPSIRAACNDNPAKFAYDSANYKVYRNYNCSLCYSIKDPSWSCFTWGEPNFGTAPSAGLRALLAVYDCPTNLDAFATTEEQRIWKEACPGITFNVGNCSETLSTTALSALYDGNPAAEYDLTTRGVWVRYNSSYVACAKCKLMNHTAANNISTYANLTVGNITVEGTKYSAPFFKTIDNGFAVCSPEPLDLPTEKCTDLPEVASQVLMILSLVGLTLYAVAYVMLQSLRNLPGQIVLHQSVAFFAGFLIFLVRVPAGIVSDEACIALGVLSHFFFLAAFTWTSVYAIEVVRVLAFQVSGEGFTKRGIRYAIFGWLIPVLITVVAIATNWAALDTNFRPAYGRPECFINSRNGHRIFFTAPLALFLLVDVVNYVYVVVKLVIISGQTKMVRQAHHEKLFLAIKLMFALGVTWIFALLASATSNCILVYIFELLNSLQGVFVFLVFVCNAKTMGQIRKKIRGSKSETSHSFTGHTNSRSS